MTPHQWYRYRKNRNRHDFYWKDPERSRAKNREYQRRARQKPNAREYHRTWMQRQRSTAAAARYRNIAYMDALDPRA